MAVFTADTAQLESIAGQLKSLGSQIDGVASRVYGTSQGINDIKSLKNKGYGGMIYGVRSSLHSLADETTMMSDRMAQIANTYASTEMTIRTEFAPRPLPGQVESMSGVAAAMNMSSDESTIVKGAIDAYNDLKNIRDANDLVEWFHRLRAGVGNDFLQYITKWSEEVPIIGSAIGSTIKYWGEKARKSLEKYENVIKILLGKYKFEFKSIDECFDKVSEIASDLLGIPDLRKLSRKFQNRADEIAKRVKKMTKEGHKLQAYAYLATSGLLTVAGFVNETGTEFAKSLAKILIPGADPLMKGINDVVGTLTGKSMDGWQEEVRNLKYIVMRSALQRFSKLFA